MPRNPVQNMDVATDWLFGNKCRRLQREHPDAWTHYWCAYLALMAEAWRSMDRELTLREVFPAAIPASVADTIAALQAVGLLDEDARIPQSTWDDRVAPAIERILARRRAGSKGGTTASSNRTTDADTDAATRADTRSVPYLTVPNLPDSARTRASGGSNDPPTESFMGWRQRNIGPDKPGFHNGAHPACDICAPVRARYEKEHASDVPANPVSVNR